LEWTLVFFMNGDLAMARLRHGSRIQTNLIILAIAVQAAGCICVSVAQGNSSSRQGKRSRFLVLDSRIIDNAQNAKLTLGEVKKHPANPLFEEDNPWEARFDNLYANVIYDEEDKIYKCWYSPFIVDNSAKGMTREQRKSRYKPPRDREMAICYAVSKDGIKWTKPVLGLVEFNGSMQNNIVWRGLSGAIPKGPHGSGIFKDIQDPDPARRYKAIFKGKKISVSFSADGIHWDQATLCPEANVAGDTHNNAFWAPTLGKYVGITRTWGEKYGRQVARTESNDFLKWTRAELVLEGLEKKLQTYAMPVFFHGGVYLGLVAIHDQKADRVWAELTWSPDTIEWNRICPGTPLIANSEKEMAYDWGCVYAGAYPIFLGDEIRIYYGGSDGYHFGWRNGFFCMSTLRPDGFAGYEPTSEDKPAVIDTRPVTCRGETLCITADIQNKGSVRVSIVDEQGNEIAVAGPVSRTVTDGKVKWTSNRKLSSGKNIRLRFLLDKAKLYSFSFTN